MRSAASPRRFLAIVVAVSLLMTLLSGTTLGHGPKPPKPPKFLLTAVATPGSVSQGGLVRFDVSFKNNSPTKLARLYMHAETPHGATLVQVLNTSQGNCWAGHDLDCAFGSLAKNQTVTFSVLYQAPSAGSSMAVRFNFATLWFPWWWFPQFGATSVTGHVALNSPTSNTAGGYIFGSFRTIQNNQALDSETNPQSAKLDFSDSEDDNFAATVTEQPTDLCVPTEDEEEYWEYSYPPETPTCFGDFVVMSVKDGGPIAGGFFVTVGYTNVPEDAQGFFIHWLVPNPAAVSDPQEGTDYEIIDEPCDEGGGDYELYSEGGDMPCIADHSTDEDGNQFWVLHMFENGPMRGF